jgi:hypothetical protein
MLARVAAVSNALFSRILVRARCRTFSFSVSASAFSISIALDDLRDVINFGAESQNARIRRLLDDSVVGSVLTELWEEL